MGQLPAKESSSSSSHRHSHHNQSNPSSTSSSSASGLPASSSPSALFQSLSLTSNKPSLPPLNLPSSFDGGKFQPQGVYPSAAQDYNHRVVHLAILNRKLAPFYKGSDDEDTYEDSEENNECPICFLYYPSPLNLSRCCSQPICTECFVQIKRADPDHTTPPSTEPAACPFCMQEEFGVTYIPPPSIREKMASESKSKSGKKIGLSTSTSASSNAASRAVGIDGELSGSAVQDEDSSSSPTSLPNSPNQESTIEGNSQVKEKMRRKSFGPNDPEVVTIDQIRPDFMEKLHLAQAAIARRANRRLIMRQVGDRLIPIGVTSGRMGAELNSRSEGPGGAIILREGERWGRVPGSSGMGGIQSIGDVTASLGLEGPPPAGAPPGVGPGSRRAGNRSGNEDGSGNRRRAELERYLAGLGQGADVEEMMMMEAMRLSLLEHEEQQRKQAEAEKAEQAAKKASEESQKSNSNSSEPVAGPSTSTLDNHPNPNPDPDSSFKSNTSSSPNPNPPEPSPNPNANLASTQSPTSPPPRAASSQGGSALRKSPHTDTSTTIATPPAPASFSQQTSLPNGEDQVPTSTNPAPVSSSSQPAPAASFSFLSSNTMAELAELIDEGTESRTASSPQNEPRHEQSPPTSSPPQVVEIPAPTSSFQSGSVSAPPGTGSSSDFTFPNSKPQSQGSPVKTKTDAISATEDLRASSPSTSNSFTPSSSPPTGRSPQLPGSPSSGTRRLNPNNPFRRGHQSGNNSPNHSRQNSNLNNGVDLMD